MTDLTGSDMVDYSAGVPSPQAIKDAGNVGVIRYVSPPREAWMKGKPLTRQEADALKAAGLAIVSNWQYGKGGNQTSDWVRGSVGATEDYKVAQRVHEDAGGHPDGVLYVSIDANPTREMYEFQVLPYLRRWQELIGRERLGVYCNGRVLQWCLDDGVGSFYWQHNWSGDNTLNNDHLAAHIHQYKIDSGKIEGVGVDDNRILKPMFGQWGTETKPVVDPEPPKEVDVTTELERIEAMRGPWRGDPTWLPDVLRLWGLQVDYIGDPDPFEDGHGDFREVVGSMMHHTAGGGVNDWRIVKWGRPGLDGPLSQVVLEKDGSVKFIAVGVAWHAGSGQGSRWADKFGTDGNWTTIGIEAVSSGVERNGRYDWTTEQLHSYKLIVAAIQWFLRKGADWSCGHLEYNLIDGKIDPAGIDLNQFRREVQELIDAGPTGSNIGGGSDQTGPPTPPLELPKEKTGIENCRDDNPWLGDKIMRERELPTPDNIGRFAHYERGSIYWTPGTGAIAVPKGGIYEFWSSVGWETSWLGYPIAPFVEHGEGKQQEFQHGTICSEHGDGKGWPVFGGIRDVWKFESGVVGRYGWPQSREYAVKKDVVGQTFSREKIYWRMNDGPISQGDFDLPTPKD